MPMPSREVVQTLLEALEQAIQHLEYCGYGDTWERSCALEEKLPAKLAHALKVGEEFLDV